MIRIEPVLPASRGSIASIARIALDIPSVCSPVAGGREQGAQVADGLQQGVDVERLGQAVRSELEQPHGTIDRTVASDEDERRQFPFAVIELDEQVFAVDVRCSWISQMTASYC